VAETRSIGEPPRVRPWLYWAGRGLSALSTASLYLAGIGLVAMTAIVAWQVFSRYVLNWSNAWTELSSILIMSWFIFFGAAVGVRENYHLGFDVLLYVLPEGSKKVLRTISDAVVFAFAIGMIVYGWQLVVLQWNERMPALGISGSFRYFPLVAGGALIALFSAERMVLRWSGVDVDQDLHDRDEVPTVDPVKEL
jgi:TRAP-type C4-dicarboxylate transport system permease small subunit